VYFMVGVHRLTSDFFTTMQWVEFDSRNKFRLECYLSRGQQWGLSQMLLQRNGNWSSD
jgi:hypothetical protein